MTKVEIKERAGEDSGKTRACKRSDKQFCTSLVSLVENSD